MTGRPVVVFDLDDTLVRGDSFGRFLRMLLLRRRLRAAAALTAAVVLVPLFILPPTRRRATAGFVWLATAGVPPERFHALAEEFAVAHTAEPRRIAVALDRLRAHLDTGDRVVVATACADPLATAVCRSLGLDGVEVIAAQLRRGRHAFTPVRGCYGAAKPGRLREIGVTMPLAHAYTDSAVDLPLLRAAAQRCLVDPSPRTLQRVRAELGDEVTVLWSLDRADRRAVRRRGRAGRSARGC
ncbi:MULTISPECIES: haloacid dehalogenase-like hydrolase [Microbispora]|uniref:Haloacid dehalogenase-like hydrolase n=1 Tax=Microbispora hainanensis TaxID=568844 RepID=A0ABZ1SVI8_9ACTN|nr:MULTISPECIES: haloacid dehalogenase-like hydrolase [Microbispora]